MNILITTSTLPRWGADSELRVVLDIAKNIKKYNPLFNIFLLAPHYRKSQKIEILEGVNIIRYKYFFEKFETLHYNGGMIPNVKRNKLNLLLIPISFLFQLLAIKKIVKKEKIDLIHAHWIIPQGLVAILYKNFFNPKIKIICTVHGVDIFGLKGKVFHFIKKLILKKCDSITCVSRAINEELLKFKINKCKITTINNGIHINFSNSSDQNINLKSKFGIKDFLLLFVGRLEEKKGVSYLIDAMSKILKEFPSTKLLIIGDGTETKNLKEKTQKLILQNNINFLGKIPNDSLASFYKSADIFIGPSIIAKNNDTEGLGMVFLEALVCGTPVISTNTGGIADIIKHNITGIIVPEKNSIEIANQVIALLKNKKKREKLIQCGKKIVVKKFNWQVISSQYSDLYKNHVIKND